MRLVKVTTETENGRQVIAATTTQRKVKKSPWAWREAEEHVRYHGYSRTLRSPAVLLLLLLCTVQRDWLVLALGL